MRGGEERQRLSLNRKREANGASGRGTKPYQRVLRFTQI